MSELIGVVNFSDLLQPQSLKREALLFHRIATKCWISAMKKEPRTEGPLDKIVDELEWLCENGVISEYAYSDETLVAHKQYRELTHLRDQLDKQYDRVSTSLKLIPLGIDYEEWREISENSPRAKEAKRLYHQTNNVEKRRISIALRELAGLDAVPVLSIEPLPANEAEANKSDVIQIVLRALPIPDDTTPWEQIIEYRSDPDSFSKFLALRNWMIEISKNNLTPIEVEQKLEFLMDQYQQHMKLHRMKVNAGALQTIVVSTAEVLEDLVKFKWGKMAKSLFAFRERKIALLEGELTAPGSEVAYITHAQETFG